MSYKNFNETVFLHELDQKLIQGNLYRSHDPYLNLTEIFSSILDKHAPVKSKTIRRNQALFMSKYLNKIIMQKCKVRNKYLKWLSSANFVTYKKGKNKFNSLVRKSKKEYFQNLGNASSSYTKSFWNAVKPFVQNKDPASNENIIIKAQNEEIIKAKDSKNELHIDANKLIKDDKILVELFYNHYINIVEKISGLAPNCIGNPENPRLDKSAVLDIINKYKDHPSITKIKDLSINKTAFEFPEGTTEDINKIAKKLNPNKATVLDRIPINVIKASANIIDSHLTYIINKDRKIN